jgi:hypothetical protein
MEALLDSGEIASEPEFEGLFVNPVACADTVAQVGKEMGYLAKDTLGLPAAEADSVRAEVIGECINRLLTEDMCQEILQRLDRLRLRTRRSGDKTKTAQTAALHWFLSSDESRTVWPMIGLVQTIFTLSIAAGFEMLEATLAALPDHAEGADVPLVDQLRQSVQTEMVDAVFDRFPGLGRYLQTQTDEIWEAGMEAIYEGSLVLGLYAPNELVGALEMWVAAMGYKSVEEMEADDGPLPTMSEQAQKALAQQMMDHVTELFTPERLDELRTRVNAITTDPAFSREWLPFVLMLDRRLRDQDAVQNEIYFLFRAMVGEVSAAGESAHSTA